VNAATVPAGLSNVVAIAAGDFGSVALKADGTVVAWGGLSVPGGVSNITAIAAGGAHVLGLNTDGTVVAWGENFQGQANVPVGLSNVVSIAAGNFHSCALRADGTVICWGSYYTGTSYVPAVAIPVLTNVVAIAAGSDHDLALLGQSLPTPQVRIPDPQRSNSIFSISVPTQSGRVYRLESQDQLTIGGWNALPLISGSGFTEFLADTNASSAQRFYRVRSW